MTNSKDKEAISIPIDLDCNFSFWKDDSQALISFPFTATGSKCPRKYSLDFRFKDGSIVTNVVGLGIWRQVPFHLARQKGGHLVFFFETNQKFADNVPNLESVSVKVVGPEIVDHELCNAKYLVD